MPAIWGGAPPAVKAAVEALKAYPLVNARIDGGDIVYQHFYDIGVAVSTEKGLMVPVFRDCDRKGFGEIESEIAALAAKARVGKPRTPDKDRVPINAGVWRYHPVKHKFEVFAHGTGGREHSSERYRLLPASRDSGTSLQLAGRRDADPAGNFLQSNK